MHLNGLDLNLLIALDALLSERNVTRASERMNISQPGMSAALQKLRWHFQDELLERIGRRLELTPRAKTLMQPVKDILFNIGSLMLDIDNFDPTTAQRVFRVSTSTMCIDVVGIELVRRLPHIAPGVSIHFDDLLADAVAKLVDGKIDLAITISQRLLVEPENLSERLSSLALFDDEMVLVVAAGNRLIGDTISLEDICAMPYFETRMGGHTVNIGEQAWANHPIQPRVCAWFPNFQLTLEAVASGDAIAMLPAELVSAHKGRYDVRTFSPPFEVPAVSEHIYWHPRNDNDAGHRWLRTMFAQAARELGLTMPDTDSQVLLAAQ